MQIETTRFGLVELTEEDLVHFDRGIIGFPNECDFAVIPHEGSTSIAWLQSASTPGLAFPVVSAHGLVSDYPDVPIGAVAEKSGLQATENELAVLAVLSAPRHQPATVNLLAPILIDSVHRRGAQVFLEGSRFSTRELFVTVPATAESRSEAPRDGVAGAEPRASEDAADAAAESTDSAEGEAAEGEAGSDATDEARAV